MLLLWDVHGMGGITPRETLSHHCSRVLPKSGICSNPELRVGTAISETP